MANNKILNTRIQLKYDTFAAWTAADPVLLAGEIAVVVVPAASNAVVQEPAILIKVGDGTSRFSTLPWTSAIAADVHDWAKAANKPVYAATEITGMGDYIANYVDETLGISVDTNTVYRVEATADGMGFVLSSQNKGEEAWAEVATIDMKAKFDALVADIATNKGNIDANAAKLVTLIADDADKSIRAIAIEEANKASAAAADVQAALEAEVKRAEAAEAANTEAIAAEKTRAEGAEKVNADAITAEVTRAKAAEQTNANAIAAEKARMDAFMAAADVGDAAVDTMKEIQEYITSDGAAADQMVKDIAANKTAIEAEVTRATGVENGLDSRLTVIEGYDHAADVKAAKDYADSLAGNYDSAGSATTAKSEAIADADSKLTTAKAELVTAINAKVDKVEGMGLSHNDFTDEDAGKLLNIEAGAEVNVIETVKVNGVALPVDNKSVNIEVVHNIDNLGQDAGTYVIFNCGSATVNI